MSAAYGLNEFCRDLNVLSGWLALDDFESDHPELAELQAVDAVVLLGNQVVATLTAACELAREAQQARLLFSGGRGHATELLYQNLGTSEFGGLVRDGSVHAAMSEAEMCAAVAWRAFGLPAKRLLVECASRNAGENARFSLQLLQSSLGRPASVVLLQDPTMQRRSVLTWSREAERAGLSSHALSHAAFAPLVEPGADGGPQLVAAQREGTWTPERYVGLVLGEMRRLHDDENGYGPRGQDFLPHVEIPPVVWESYQRTAASAWAGMAAR